MFITNYTSISLLSFPKTPIVQDGCQCCHNPIMLWCSVGFGACSLLSRCSIQNFVSR